MVEKLACGARVSADTHRSKNVQACVYGDHFGLDASAKMFRTSTSSSSCTCGSSLRASWGSQACGLTRREALEQYDPLVDAAATAYRGIVTRVPYMAEYRPGLRERDRLRPISTSANFWMLNLGDKVWGPRRVRPKPGNSGAPKGGEPRRVEPRRVEPRRVGGPKSGGPKPRKSGAPKGGAPKGGAPKGGAPKGGAPKGGGPKILRFFFPPPATIFFLLSLSWGPFVEFWWCLKRRGPEMCTFGVLGLSCEALAAPKPRREMEKKSENKMKREMSKNKRKVKKSKKTKQKKKKKEREKEETEQTPSVRVRPINFDFGQLAEVELSEVELVEVEYPRLRAARFMPSPTSPGFDMVK